MYVVFTIKARLYRAFIVRFSLLAKIRKSCDFLFQKKIKIIF